MPTDRPRPGECGSSLPLIIGFVAIVLVLVGVVIDASAAYLRRQSLDSLADGAALRGADLGAAGEETYAGGVGETRLQLSDTAVRAAVAAYLRDVGARRRYPGLRIDAVRVDPLRRTVEIRISAPLDLPLSVPGSPRGPRVGARGSASVAVDAADEVDQMP